MDTRAQSLRHSNGGIDGGVLRHAVTDDHQGALSRGQGCRGGLDRARVGTGARISFAGRRDRHVGLTIERLRRKSDKRRTRRRRPRLGKRAPHHGWNLVSVGDLGAPLRERPGESRQVGAVVGHLGQAAVHRREHERRPAGIGVEQQAHPIRQTRIDVQVDERDVAGGSGIAVSHTHGDAFLRGENVLQVRRAIQRIHQRALGGAGVAKHVAHALGTQRLDDGKPAAHHPHGAPPNRPVSQPRAR